MTTITWQDLPAELATAIEQIADREGQSLDRTVIRLLEEATQTRCSNAAETRYHDLDHLAGSWSDSEADAFDTVLKEQRVVDPELWK